MQHFQLSQNIKMIARYPISIWNRESLSTYTGSSNEKSNTTTKLISTSNNAIKTQTFEIVHANELMSASLENINDCLIKVIINNPLALWPVAGYRGLWILRLLSRSDERQMVVQNDTDLPGGLLDIAPFFIIAPNFNNKISFTRLGLLCLTHL